MCDGVLCVMCRGGSRVCVISAAMMSRVCVLSAAVRGVCVCCMEHWKGFSKFQTDIYGIILAPQVNIGMKYL